MADAKSDLLRHTLATLAYRGGKAVRGAPQGFAEFRAGESARTPGQILAHIGDLFDWAVALAEGRRHWNNSTPLPWQDEVNRFFAGIAAFDAKLAGDEPIACPAEKLFQGPIADALTHIGQIAMLRGLAGSPVRGENYFLAGIAKGVTGDQQPSAALEF